MAVADLLLLARAQFDLGKFNEAEVPISSFLSHEGLSEEARGLALYQYSWVMRAQGNQESDKATLIDSQLALVAAQINNTFIQALSQFRQGDRHFCAGRLNSAKKCWEHSLELFELSGARQSYEFAYLKFHLGILYRDLFGFAVAVEHLSFALELARQIPIPYLIRQCLTELFFCYFYQGDLSSCVLCFDQIKNYNREHLSEIENLILSSYLDLYNKKFISSRKKLIDSYLLVKKHRIAKNRYDLYFHFSYLYAKKGNFAKAFSFMRGSQDPIYKLMLLQIEAESKMDLKSIMQYKKFADLCGIIYHQECAQHMLSVVSKVYLPISTFLNEGFIVVRGKKIVIKKQPLIVRSLELALTRKLFSKKEILEYVFEFKYYESIIHDQKVYKLVTKLNEIISEPLFVAKDKMYHLNPLIQLTRGDKESVSASVLIREILLNLKSIHKNISLNLIRRVFGIKSKRAVKEAQRLDDAGLLGA